MSNAAYDAIAEAWEITKLIRSLFPSTPYPESRFTEIVSPSWYQQIAGVGGQVSFLKPVTGKTLNNIGKFVNESFVIFMMAILEEFEVVSDEKPIDLSKEGGKYVQLVRWYRNRFAHGESEFDPANPKHVETRALLEELFPNLAKSTTGFPTSIDSVLPDLVAGVLAYIGETT